MLNITTYQNGDWNRTTLKSITSGVYWYISVPSGVTVSGVTVQDSYASGNQITALTSSGNIDAGHNLNWIFSYILPSGVDYSGITKFLEFVTYHPLIGISSNYQHTKKLIEFVPISGLVGTGSNFNSIYKLVEFVPINGSVQIGGGFSASTKYIDFVTKTGSVWARVLYCDGPLYEYPDDVSGTYSYPTRTSGTYVYPIRITGVYVNPERTRTCRYRNT